MLFNSFLFLIFFLLVYCLYHAVQIKYKKYILYISSIIFYGSWDYLNFSSIIPRFLIHFLFVITVNYLFLLGIQSSQGFKRKIFLVIIILLNILNLGFFKYFYFFTDILGNILAKPNLKTEMIEKIPIILPIAISFYTFQIIAFIVDEYKGVYSEKTSYLDFSIFILFFPQQLAGPILRATDFLPQLNNPQKIKNEQIIDGISLVGFGLIKKVILADSIAFLIDPVYANPTQYSYKALLCAFVGFIFQLWGDFSGYSDIARGCGKLLGFELPKNFIGPLFSNGFKDMWVRWHITLSSFLRDYIYFPLGGNKKGKLRTEINGIITMLLGGLWHGANWNFILWGFLVGISITIERNILDKFYFWKESRSKLAMFVKILSVNIFWFFLALIFRIQNLSDIEIFLKGILSFKEGDKILYENFIYLTFLFYLLHYIEFDPKIIQSKISNPIRYIFICSIILLFVISSFSNRQVQFYYFQF